MRKPGLTTGTIVATVALLLSISVHAHASSKDEKAIRDVENRMIATTNTDDLMKYYDQNDVDVTILPGRCSTKATPPFVATLTTYSPILLAPKAISSSWSWSRTVRWGWPAASSTSPGLIRPGSRRR